jgi:SAM-dependent methyltransferase
MESKGSDWYKKNWTLDIKNQSWVEDTPHQVDFIIRMLALTGKERILDLACGFGRHALEFARRGYSVTGVDITKAYVEDAAAQALKEKIDAHFIHADIRDVSFENEFDVVLNMADGAIGYLENDGENLKLFDVVSKALKPGGKHFMDIMNAGYADTHFPCQFWDAGKKGLTLSKFEWDKDSKIMMYGQLDYAYGTSLPEPVMGKGNPTQLYHIEEIRLIMEARHMHLRASFSNFTDKSVTDNDIQMENYSQKE